MPAEFKDKSSSYRDPELVLSELEHIPVALLRDHVREHLRLHPNFVLVGETGSGKTTCLPPLLLELKNELGLKGKIGITQPRRVATRSNTNRVSEMMGTEVGQTVGYQVRFDDSTSPETDIVYMTDGILLRKIQFDPLLTEFSIIMVDEAHERSLNIDLCLGLLKGVNLLRLEQDREPLRLVVSSATIERNKFSEYIGLPNVSNTLEIPGKMFPVTVSYEDETPWKYDYTQAAAQKVKAIIDRRLPGDILIFMPGKNEINLTIENIILETGGENLEIIPLHAELPPEEQDKIFQPSAKRKVIVSTNIAETSVTIDGIVHVIDSGYLKQTFFDPSTGIEQLMLVEHALSGLEQRKGRAGRTASGFCYRLFTEASLKRRPRYQSPEIERSNLAQIVLAMKKVGIKDIANFNFIDSPDREGVRQALQLLTLFGALDATGHLTKIGHFMADLGLEPRLSRMVIESAMSGTTCLNEICTITAFLNGKNIFVRPLDFGLEKEATRLHSRFKNSDDSDFDVLLNIWNAYAKSGYSDHWAQNNFLNEKALDEARNVRLELVSVLKSRGLEIDESIAPRTNLKSTNQAITAGLLANLIVHTGKHAYKKVDGTKSDIYIHPSSVFFGGPAKDNFLLVSDEIFMNTQGKAYASHCLRVNPEWLRQLAPHLSDALPKPQKPKPHSRRHRHHRS